MIGQSLADGTFSFRVDAVNSDDSIVIISTIVERDAQKMGSYGCFLLKTFKCIPSKDGTLSYITACGSSTTTSVVWTSSWSSYR